MKIIIAGQDYTYALDAHHPLTIERKLNEPSSCRLWISLPAGKTRTLARSQSVQITGDDGTLYFTGYIAATPMPEYAGFAVEGPRFRLAIEAVSDEYLLDQSLLAPSRELVGLDAGPAIAALVAKTGSSAVSTGGLSLQVPISSVAVQPGASFSTAAANVANQARATYRAINGSIALSSLPAALHMLDEDDSTLSPADITLTTSTARSMANDITVCGEHEPTTYVTEYFIGDGVTTQFNLSDSVFAPPEAKSALIRELFNEGRLDPRFWGISGDGDFLSLGSGGLSMQGGSGRDGETQLAWLDAFEMGGTLLLEATGVALANGSNGILAGFFVGDRTQEACTAGFKVTAQQGTGPVSIQPVVLGSPQGMLYAINPQNRYALRVRLHCSECHRGTAIYRSFDDQGPVMAGGDWNIAPADLQFEIQEFISGVAGMPVTLYEGNIANLSGTCNVVAASSISLRGSMRTFGLTNLGSGWVVTTPPHGNPSTRRIGASRQSAECAVERGGRLVFYPGFTPATGEQIAVSYRTVGRASGRAVNTESQQSLADSGFPPVSAWIGTVISPPARSSRDCRNAASVLQRAAASTNALWMGTYTCPSPRLDADVWPGDALKVRSSSAGIDSEMIVRKVNLKYLASVPDLVDYSITFANDWAEDLAIKTCSTVPADAWLPAEVSPVYAPNLNGLTILDISGSSITIGTGIMPPPGGGFEVRRRDNCFMPGSDEDLVLRSSQPTMTFSRLSAWDRFYVRIFDGADPPNYSEFSAALIFNLPLSM